MNFYARLVDHTPFPLRGDAYTISGESFAGPKAIEKSVYNLTNRISPLDAIPGVARDSRMVLYGVNEFIQRHLRYPISFEDIELSKEFMSTAHSFGGPLYFPEETWKRVGKEYNGFLPIRITGLPEGSTFFPNEPAIQVESLAEGFGELAAHIEAVMLGMVSTMSAKTTICRHWLDRIREEFGKNKYNNPNFSMSDATSDDLKEFDGLARFFIHDFGMRASSCAEESELLGMAHLLVFHGTDTFNAAYRAMQRGAKRPTGTSILALAHRIVQGHSTEQQSYEAIYNAAGENGIASYVADCYDFHSAVKGHLKMMAKRAKGCVVARPDSGNYLENCLYIAQQAYEAGLHDSADRPSATSMRFIQGDSMNPDKVQNVFDGLYDIDLNSVGWGIFGIGGYLRNTATRDLFSSAYKLAAIGSEYESVCKLSDTPAKMSVGGNTVVTRTPSSCFEVPSVYSIEEKSDDARIVFWDGTRVDLGIHNESFDSISNRTIEEFDSFAGVDVNYGISGKVDVLSTGLRKIQQETIEKYRS